MYDMEGMLVVLCARGSRIPNMCIYTCICCVCAKWIEFWSCWAAADFACQICMYMYTLYMYDMEGIVFVLGARGSCIPIPNMCIHVLVVYV